MAHPRLIITDPASPQANRTSPSTRPHGATPHTALRSHTSSQHLHRDGQRWGPARASPPAMPSIYARQDPALYPVPASPCSEAGVSLETARDLAGATGGPWDGAPFHCHVTHPPAPSPSPRPAAVSPSGEGEVREGRAGKGLNHSGSSTQHREEARKTAISLLSLLPTRPAKSCEL